MPNTSVKPAAPLSLYLPTQFISVLKHVGMLTGNRSAAQVARGALGWWIKHNPEVRQLCEQFDSRITEYDTLTPKALRTRRRQDVLDAERKRQEDAAALHDRAKQLPSPAESDLARPISLGAWANVRKLAEQRRQEKLKAAAAAAAAPDAREMAAQPPEGVVDEQVELAMIGATDPPPRELPAPAAQEPPTLTAADVAELAPVRVVHRKRRNAVISTGPTIAETMQAKAPLEAPPVPDPVIPVSTAKLMPQWHGEQPTIAEKMKARLEKLYTDPEYQAERRAAAEPEAEEPPKRRTLRFRPVGTVPPPAPPEEEPFDGF